jgi:hypothetical protein
MNLSFRLPSALGLLAALAVANSLSAVSFNYSSANGATINFDGAGNFSFTTTPDSFDVTSGSAAGRTGDILGTFAIGVIGGNDAPVTGAGSFIVHAADGDLTANLAWVTISQNGAGGGLNTLTASVNLSNIVYAGANADLVALKNDGNGVTTLTFQFTSTLTLQQLKSQVVTNSFSGTVTSVRVPDGGTSIALLGMALTALAVIRRKILA